MGTQPRNNETLCIYGGTEMTSSDELRDRIAELIDAALVAWNTDMDTQDSEGAYAAQAVIDEFGLTVEMRVSSVGRTVDRRTGIVTSSTQTRIVGKWEQR